MLLEARVPSQFLQSVLPLIEKKLGAKLSQLIPAKRAAAMLQISESALKQKLINSVSLKAVELNGKILVEKKSLIKCINRKMQSFIRRELKTG